MVSLTVYKWKTFYNGLNSSARLMVDASASGACYLNLTMTLMIFWRG